MSIIIKLDVIRDIAYIGIRRAAIFMGFSINCSNRKDCIDFSLEKHSMYRFTPELITEENINEYKIEYQKWIIANSFSELVNSFEVFLDEIFKALSYVEKPNSSVKSEYHRKGIGTKLKILKDNFNINSNLQDSFESINKARNCLYHRRGNVAEQDTNTPDKKLQVKWLGLDIQYEKEDGELVQIETPVIDTHIVGKGKSVIIITNERKKEFDIGNPITFSVKELSEICYHFNIEVDDIFQKTIQYFKDKQIKVEES